MGAKDPNEIDRLVGSRVRQRRMQLGMSQEHLAAQLGLTVPQLQKYEKGVNRIGASRLHKIAGLLGVLIGAWTATRQYKISDRSFTASSLFILSVPSFVIASVLQVIATNMNNATGLRLFEFVGETGQPARLSLTNSSCEKVAASGATSIAVRAPPNVAAARS